MNALIYFLIWAVLIFLFMRFGCGAHVAGHGHGRSKHGGAAQGGQGPSETLRWIPPESGVDPVCGKSVSTEGAKLSVHDGMVYYFCSRNCRDIFEAAPKQYVGSKPTIPRPELENRDA